MHLPGLQQRPFCTRCGTRMNSEEGCFRCPSCQITYCTMMKPPAHAYEEEGHPPEPETDSEDTPSD